SGQGWVGFGATTGWAWENHDILSWSFCSGSTSPPCATPPSGLVSWWRGQGNALDETGSNHGTLAGNTSFGPGRVGQAFVLDGNGDGVSLGNPTHLQVQNF